MLNAPTAVVICGRMYVLSVSNTPLSNLLSWHPAASTIPSTPLPARNQQPLLQSLPVSPVSGRHRNTAPSQPRVAARSLTPTPAQPAPLPRKAAAPAEARPRCLCSLNGCGGSGRWAYKDRKHLQHLWRSFQVGAGCAQGLVPARPHASYRNLIQHPLIMPSIRNDPCQFNTRAESQHARSAMANHIPPSCRHSLS